MQPPFYKRYHRYPLQTAVRNVAKNLDPMGIQFTPQTMDHIADKADRVAHGDKKNPIAFLLGFYVVVNGEISFSKLKYVHRHLHKLDTPPTIEDVIRYARLVIK